MPLKRTPDSPQRDAGLKPSHPLGKDRAKAGRHIYGDGMEFLWWLEPKDRMGMAAYEIARRVHRQQMWRLHQMRRNAQIFAGFYPTAGVGLGQPWHSIHRPVFGGQQQRMPFNVTRPVIQTAVSVVTKGDVKTTAMTSEGDWGLQQKAKEINRFSEGVFYHNDMRQLGPRIAQDACVYYRGMMQCEVLGDEVLWDRILANELLVEDADGLYGNPRCIYRSRWAPREDLAARFPKHRKEIEQAAADGWDERYVDMGLRVTELLRWVEAWRRPSTPGADDGVYAAGMRDITLDVKKWDMATAPIATMKWCDPDAGWYGEPLMDALRPAQRDINTTLRTIGDTMRLGSPMVWAKSGSKIPKNFFTNQVLGVGFYSGDAPPTFWPGAQINPQQMEYLDRKINEAYESAGVSRQESNAMKPLDVKSGVAIRETRDIRDTTPRRPRSELRATVRRRHQDRAGDDPGCPQ